MATSIYLGNPPPKIKEWIEKNYKPEVDMTKVPLHFTANNPTEETTVQLNYIDNLEDELANYCPYSFVYSSDEMKTWNAFDVNSTVVDLNECENGTVYIKAKFGNTTENPNRHGFTDYEYMDDEDIYDILHYLCFDIKGSVKAGGNIQFLLDNTGSRLDVPKYGYYRLFTGCVSLTQSPKLPATTLAYNCYNNMFTGCTALPEPKYDMSHMTFEQVANAIQNDYIFDDWYNGDPIKVQCSDKILVATFNKNNYEWTITKE